MSRSASLRKSGNRWYLRFYDGSRPRGRQRKEISLKTNRKDVAEKRAVELRERFEKGRFDPWTDGVGKKTLTLSEAVDAFLEAKKGGVQPRTLGTYRQQLEAWQGECPGGLRLRDLTPGHVRGYTHARRRIRDEEKSVSAATRRKRWRHVKAFCNWAVKTGHLELSPLDEMEAPKKDERLPAWLTAEELSRLLEYIQWHGENVQDAAGRMPDVAWLRDAILVCLSCGLRRGEIAALRWEHVDLERGMIHVQHGEDFRTKSGAERVVPVRGKALERLRGQAEEAEGTPTGPVITDRRGLPVKPDRYTRVFKRMVRGAKLRNRERLNFHSLRHSCGAWLASQGVSERIIQEVLGHASTQTTQIYSHVAGSAVEGAMERVFGGK